MILMKTEHACGRCPNAMMCMARKKLAGTTYCSRCGCVTFKHDSERYLCTLLREGVHSRMLGDKAAIDWQHLTPRQHGILHVQAAVLAVHAEYEGCARKFVVGAQTRFRHRRRTRRWSDCVGYFREINGFDAEL